MTTQTKRRCSSLRTVLNSSRRRRLAEILEGPVALQRRGVRFAAGPSSSIYGGLESHALSGAISVLRGAVRRDEDSVVTCVAN
jgi:hypothetical protein